MLRTILIAIVAILGGFAVIVAMQPAEYRVERTATIAAPAETVFTHVNDFHKWDAWSPWAKLDPDAKVKFEGPSSGHGSVFTWSGNDQVGEGRMTIVESTPDDRVKINVNMMKPFEAASTTEFDLTPAGDQTAVTWTMSGEHGFIGKAMCLIMNGTEMLGGEMDKGLARMKQVVEGDGKAQNPT